MWIVTRNEKPTCVKWFGPTVSIGYNSNIPVTVFDKRHKARSAIDKFLHQYEWVSRDDLSIRKLKSYTPKEAK